MDVASRSSVGEGSGISFDDGETARMVAVKVTESGIEADRRARRAVWRSEGMRGRLCNHESAVSVRRPRGEADRGVLRGLRRGSFIPRCTAYLQGHLYECSGVVLDEDDVSEAGVDEAFEMAFSHACVCVVLVPTFLALSGGVGW